MKNIAGKIIRKLGIVAFSMAVAMGNAVPVMATVGSIDDENVSYTWLEIDDTASVETNTADVSQFNALEYAIVNQDVLMQLGTDENILFNHYLTYGINEGRTLTIADALEKGQNISASAMLACYLVSNREYYLAHGLEEDFPFFNVEAYAEMYPDVAEASENDKEKMLLHYLYIGAYEGRSCGTSFDPIVAMVANLATAIVAVKNDYNPEIIQATFATNTGATTTVGITIGISDQEVLAVKRVAENAPAGASVNLTKGATFDGVSAINEKTGEMSVNSVIPASAEKSNSNSESSHSQISYASDMNNANNGTIPSGSPSNGDSGNDSGDSNGGNDSPNPSDSPSDEGNNDD